MSQEKQFQKYGYDQYLKAPKKNKAETAALDADGSGFMAEIFRNLRSPVVATVALLAAGAIFTSVIVSSYPSGDNAPEEIPIVKADLSPVKSQPEDQGGMDVPFRDSTVLSAVDGDVPNEGVSNEDEGARIENLLAQANEDLASREDSFARAVSEGGETASPEEDEDYVPHERGMYSAENEALKPKAAEDLLQKIDPAEQGQEKEQEQVNEQLAAAQPDQQELASAPNALAEKPKQLHPAATSPETMDYVRSVLNEEGEKAAEEASLDGEQDDSAAVKNLLEPQEPMKVASQEKSLQENQIKEKPLKEKSAKEKAKKDLEKAKVQDIEPAAGVATPAVKMSPGDYYVQLASITDRNKGAAEFAKLQKKYPALAGMRLRLEEAHLSKGTFYRIQAGPVSKASAQSICGQIKKQGAGGCLLVK